MPSIIIPAHNEAALIAQCIASALQSSASPLEIIVVPNACTDQTEAIARSFGPRVTVVPTAVPGKSHALNLGESRATLFPRAFLDGDIVLLPGALDAAFRELKDNVHLASPPAQFDISGAPWVVREFYKALSCNPYFSQGAPNGSGVFVVSEQGRGRWMCFPEIISDDGYVQLHFCENERRTAAGPAAIVQTPRDIRSLLAIQTRARLGSMELRQKFPDLMLRNRTTGATTIRRLLFRPTLWPAGLVFLVIRWAERRIAHQRLARSGYTGWLRDDSSRVAAQKSEA